MPPILVDLLNTVQYSTVHRLVLPRQRTIMKACTPCS